MKHQKSLNVFYLIFVILLLAACGDASTVSSESASPADTPVPPTDTPTPTSSQVILGYIEDIPAAFVEAESGLVIEMPEVIYAETGALESYKASIKLVAGEVLELEFYDLTHTETGLVNGYTASIDGTIMDGPSKEEFENIMPGYFSDVQGLCLGYGTTTEYFLFKLFNHGSTIIKSILFLKEFFYFLEQWCLNFDFQVKVTGFTPVPPFLTQTFQHYFLSASYSWRDPHQELFRCAPFRILIVYFITDQSLFRGNFYLIF